MQKGGILTRGLETCLFLYPLEEWELLSNRVKELPLTGKDARNFSRYLFSGAVEVKFDRLGRMNIPAYLVEHAKLEKNLVIVGVLNRVEIWSKNSWERFSKTIGRSSEEIAEKLSGSGI